MSFTAVWLWTLLRSLLLMGIALPWCGWLVRWIRSSPPRRRGWQLGLLTLPVLFPELLTGYAYSQMTRLLITGFWTRELWFDLLLVSRVIPIGTLLWYCSPPSPLSREAWHVRRLALRPEESVWKRWGIVGWYWLQGPARSGLFAACGLFLVLFQEFELASLLAVTSWTVWLFDAQAGGLSLEESLKCCIAPAMCTWLMCGGLLWLVSGKSLRGADQSATPRPLSSLGKLVCWTYLAAALGLIVIYPCVLIGREALPGVVALASNGVQLRGLLQGILVAAGFGLISGYSADLLAGWLLRSRERCPTSPIQTASDNHLAPLAPVLGGEGQGVRGPERRAFSPHPRPLSPPDSHFKGRGEGGLFLILFRRASQAASNLIARPPSNSNTGNKSVPASLWSRLPILLAGVGLSGSLIIGLCGVAVFQWNWLRRLYDTPLPLIMGLVIWLLPRALLLHGMLHAVRSPVMEHAARMLLEAGDLRRSHAAREILWQLHGRSATIVRLLLCHWAYWELTLPGVLTPAGLEPAPVRLYIDMHFSRNALLTAKAGLTLLAPVWLVAACWQWLKKTERSDMNSPPL